MTGRGSRENSGQNGGRRLATDFLKPSSKEVRSSDLGIYSHRDNRTAATIRLLQNKNYTPINSIRPADRENAHDQMMHTTVSKLSKMHYDSISSIQGGKTDKDSSRFSHRNALGSEYTTILPALNND